MINQQKISGICLSNGKLSRATVSSINSYQCKREFVPFAPYLFPPLFDATKIVPPNIYIFISNKLTAMLSFCIFILMTASKGTFWVFKTSNFNKDDRKCIFTYGIWKIQARSTLMRVGKNKIGPIFGPVTGSRWSFFTCIMHHQRSNPLPNCSDLLMYLLSCIFAQACRVAFGIPH